VRTARSEATDWMLTAGPRHLRAILDEYVAHYNHHRPHRARNLAVTGRSIPFPGAVAPRRGREARDHAIRRLFSV
jgi:transposase InsO family protein